MHHINGNNIFAAIKSLMRKQAAFEANYKSLKLFNPMTNTILSPVSGERDLRIVLLSISSFSSSCNLF